MFESQYSPHILIVEDDADNLEYFCATLETEYRVSTAKNANGVVEMLEKATYDLIILDVKLKGSITGMDLCEEIKKKDHFRHIPIILVTGYGDIKMAVDAMNIGAFYFLTKPVHVGDLLLLVKQGLETSRLHREVAYLKNKLQKDHLTEIIGKSPQMQKVLQMIAQVAPRDTTVMIQGSSGTGKELVARAIHRNSHRKEQPFVAVDCGTLPENLLESTLFGHVKGAFTGAVSARKGLFVSADKGTLFLDEISNLPIGLQTRLLRVLQEFEIFPVGSDKSTKVDVRVLTASNVDLKNMVEEGKFRNDLYFRLNVINIELPDLAQRKGDIPILAQHFLEKYRKNGHKISTFSKTALRMLMDYEWSGNVRELENVIEYATIVGSKNEVSKEDLPAAFQEKKNIDPGNLPPLYTLRDLEKEYLRQVLDHCGNNQSKAAKILGIDRKSLWRKFKRYNLCQP